MDRKVTMLLSATVCTLLFTGCGSKQLTDPENPTTLTVWHYYNGSQQKAFQSLTEEFNETVGKEKGIIVESTSKGSVADLETAVNDSLDKKVGAEELPDMFSAYADTAYAIEQKGQLANLSEYLSEEECSEYVESYIEEGEIAEDGTLRIFPVAKSTEVMMLNQTDWDKFVAETGASADDLATLEGIVRLSEQYYNWTDEKTPDIANDGKAFYGRDSVANYFVIGMRQQGSEICKVENGEVTFDIDKDKIRRLWDNYYAPFIKGYFASYGAFRSDDVKTGDLIAYTGSTASAMYFPDQIESEGDIYPIEYMIMAAPKFENAENFAIQQGAGIVVTKSDEVREYASVEFLKWMTEAGNNIRFGCEAGYLPVKTEANTKEELDKVIEENAIQVSDKIYGCLVNVFEQGEDMQLYTSKSFSGAYSVRKILEYSLTDKAVEDRSAIVEAMNGGATLEEASASYLTDEAFDKWYAEFDASLKEAVK